MIKKKALIVLIAPLLISLIFSQIDDDLSKESVTLIGYFKTNRVSDSYLHLSGIFASENENPIDVGKNILEETRKLEGDRSYKIVEYQEAKKIPLPVGEAFCKTWEDGCLTSLFSSEVDIEDLKKVHAVLIGRAKEFFEFEEYSTLSKPTFSEALPPYQYIATAERIGVLSAINIYKKGNPEKAIESLRTQILKLRKAMELQDNLIGKLVFLMKLSEIIDVSSVILAQTGTKIESIPALTQSEKSFYLVSAREFAMSYYTLQNLDKHPEFFEIGGNFPGWITRILYKPNMTINAITPVYVRLEHLANLSPSDFASDI